MVKWRKEWDVCPNLRKNFKCELTNRGKWRLEESRTGKEEWGKVIFLISPIGEKIAPTRGDQRNFFTGLFEAEWYNDNFVFKDGTSIDPQREKGIKMFEGIIKDIKERGNIKDTPRGISFYIERSQNE